MSNVTIEEIMVEGSSYLTSLSKLLGHEIKDIQGYLNNGEFGFVVFKICKIELADGAILDVGGEHDIAFIYNEDLEKQVPGIETLHRNLYPDECEEEDYEGSEDD